MPHPADERALKLTRAMVNADLDTLGGLISWGKAESQRSAVSSLIPLFKAASEQGINLLHPPEDFQDWLLKHAALNLDDTTATSTTIKTRLSRMSVIYTQLIDEGLLLTHPMRGMRRPVYQRPTDPRIPAPDEVLRMLAHTPSAELRAAFTLIYHHAFRGAELAELTWAHYFPDKGELVRRFQLTVLDQVSHHALEELRAKAGGVYAPERERIFPDNDAQLRVALARTCRAANLTPFSISALRRASLRDFTHRMESAGFANQQWFDEAVAAARRA